MFYKVELQQIPGTDDFRETIILNAALKELPEETVQEIADTISICTRQIQKIIREKSN